MTGQGPQACVIGGRAAAAPRSLLDLFVRAARGGARYLQLRDPGASDADLVELARSLRTRIDAEGLEAEILVNDRCDIALAAGAAGVQLKSTGLPTAAARSIGRGRLLIGRSTHTIEEVRRAGAEGVDFILFGPVFASPGKEPQGLDALRKACAAAEVPVFALGGVEPRNAGACVRAGAAGLAVVRTVLSAEDPEQAVRALLRAARRAELKEFDG